MEDRIVTQAPSGTPRPLRLTALDARQLGLETYLVVEGVRGVDLKPGGSQAAIRETEATGLRIVHETDITGTGSPQ